MKNITKKALFVSATALMMASTANASMTSLEDYKTLSGSTPAQIKTALSDGNIVDNDATNAAAAACSNLCRDCLGRIFRG